MISSFFFHNSRSGVMLRGATGCVQHVRRLFSSSPSSSSSFNAIAVKCFPHLTSGTNSFVLHDKMTKRGVIIDPVADFEYASDTQPAVVSYHTTTHDMLQFLHKEEVTITHILETHVHADHLSSSQFLKRKLPNQPLICIHQNITQVQRAFLPKFHPDDDSLVVFDGHEFDVLLQEGDEICIGSEFGLRVHGTPGHTPACATFALYPNTNNANNNSPICMFTGDTLFHASLGCSRADFEGGSAEQLYHSLRRIIDMAAGHEESVLLYFGHDYPGKEGEEGSRQREWQTTVAHALKHNPVLRMSKEEFISFREERDATLDVPALMWPSIQTNVVAGTLPMVLYNQFSPHIPSALLEQE